MKHSKYVLLFTLILFSTSCYDQDNQKERPCPTKCTDTISCQGIGNLDFFISDQTWLSEKCGFEQEWEQGTLQMTSCNGGLFLLWAYNHLTIISVGKGWNGTTKEGLKIDDSLEKLLTIYPNAQKTEDKKPTWENTIFVPEAKDIYACMMYVQVNNSNKVEIITYTYWIY